MQIKQLIVIAICLIGITKIQTAGSQELNPIEQAQQLIDQGDPEKAITILRKLQPKLEGIPAFDYVFGLACVDTGRNVEAIFALERVIDTIPDHGPARTRPLGPRRR